MSRNFKYDSIYGPDIRVGILQEQDKIRIDLTGEYMVTDETGAEIASLRDAKLTMCPVDTTPAKLTWHIVAGKADSEQEAEALPVPQDETLAPWTTECMGAELAPNATAVEFWRCSKAFFSKRNAEEARNGLKNNECLAVTAIRQTKPLGFVKIIDGTNAMLTGKTMLRFVPSMPDMNRVTVYDVIVGIEYHWRHLERHHFRGAIEVRVDNAGKLTVVNELPVEQYLFSVNSSEMMSVMPDELLKAQTVAARNTVFATMDKHHHTDDFHICADDHCQCYRGSSRETPDSRRLTMATFGLVLTHNGKICDCRYSKSCGGLMESMDSVWHEAPRGYLPSGVDAQQDAQINEFYPCNTEEKAQNYLRQSPQCWCNTTQGEIPTYLNYTKPYFRWTVRYKRTEVEQYLNKFLDTEIGELLDLIPQKRGDSARIEYLKVRATNGEWIIGKEFNIRKALSETFLYSSAFIPEFDKDDEGHITEIRLIGGGWGHGAGLCQIGATMMAYKGKTFKEILLHYFPNTILVNDTKLTTTEQEKEIIKGYNADSREGERCFEFFNCYGVASCPLIKKGVQLIAHETSENEFIFEATGLKNDESLPENQSFCKQLIFGKKTAEEKK